MDDEKGNWEVYTINLTTTKDEGSYGYVAAALEKDRTDITDRFETELFELIAKYNKYGKKFNLVIEATNSDNQPIIRY